MNDPQTIYATLKSGSYTEASPMSVAVGGYSASQTLRDALRILANADGMYLGTYGPSDYMTLQLWLYDSPPPPPDPASNTGDS